MRLDPASAAGLPAGPPQSPLTREVTSPLCPVCVRDGAAQEVLAQLQDGRGANQRLEEPAREGGVSGALFVAVVSGGAGPSGAHA